LDSGGEKGPQKGDVCRKKQEMRKTRDKHNGMGLNFGVCKVGKFYTKRVSVAKRGTKLKVI